jgi:CRP/FNR family transcriptional regulator, cyclic AMP receptor protein
MDVATLLSGNALFRNLGNNEIDQISRSTRLDSFRAGQVIVREGRVGAAFFIIVSGKVEVVKDLGSARETVLATLGPEEFFGEISTMKHLLRSASVRATEDSDCLVIRRTDFEAFISQFPAVAIKIEAAARARLAEAQDQNL